MADPTPTPTALAAQTQLNSLRAERDQVLGYIAKKNARVAVIDALLGALHSLGAESAPEAATTAGTPAK